VIRMKRSKWEESVGMWEGDGVGRVDTKGQRKYDQGEGK
jgi:hypothetical protein